MDRVRIDFWIQNSRLFPDFFQNNIFFAFSRLRVIKWMINRHLKKHRNKALFNDILQAHGQDWIRFAVALKKNSRLFTIFPDFIATSQTFSRSGKLLSKFQQQDFFKNSRLCTNLDLLQVDLLASGVSLFWPRSSRLRATKWREVDLSRLKGFYLHFKPKMGSSVTSIWGFRFCSVLDFNGGMCWFDSD